MKISPLTTVARLLGIALSVCLSLAKENTHAASAQNPFGKRPANATEADRFLVHYFERETRALEESSLSQIRSAEDFIRSKESTRQQLREMLGLHPLPEKSALQATVTGTLEHDEIAVEKLHFQSLPGLYVTGNLYRPKALSAPAPTVLYVCGHGAEKLQGISYGNKVHYQHWGAWFARNGYVCLILDTVQLGEIEGVHHGTFSKGMWWWNSRGFTSAGVEAWNGIRALDYLETRPDVDKSRIGITGRSGGGAYSWWIAALDERIRAACPTAGITDLRNHVIDSCVEGHCDCMFMVNTYRWDFPQLAALVAPRPLLICNTDKDPIFPLDGVHRVYDKVRRIYELLQVPRQIGLVITEGPHQDTQELQLPVMRWFNKWLRNSEAPVPNFAEKLFTHQQLKVFESLPTQEITSHCFESFTRLASDQTPLNGPAVLAQLRAKTFAAWPSLQAPLNLQRKPDLEDPTKNQWHFEGLPDSKSVLLFPFQKNGSELAPTSVHLFLRENGTSNLPAPESLPQNSVAAIFHPIASGESGLGGDSKYRNAVRRKFMLLGTTLGSVQVYEVLRALQALRQIPGWSKVSVHLHADESFTEVACFAALYDSGLSGLHLQKPPRNDKEAVDFLNWSRILTPMQLLRLAEEKTRLSLSESAP